MRFVTSDIVWKRALNVTSHVPASWRSTRARALHDRLWHRMAKIARRLGDRDPDPEIPPRRPKWGRRPKRVKAHGSVLDAMLGVFTVRHRPQEDPTPIDRLRQPHSGWLARRAGGHLRRSSVLHAMSSPRLDPGLLRTTRRPGAVIFRPFPLHAITARNKAPSFILRMHKIRAASPMTREFCPLTVQFRTVGPSAPCRSDADDYCA